MQALAEPAGLAAATVRWLPEEPPFRFLADPFGLWRDGRLHLFAEAYDYRTRHGVIDLLQLDADLGLARRVTVLRESWHLSYPFVFEVEGVAWMAPEAHRSDALTLYRETSSLERWEPVARLELDAPPVDPTIFRHGGLWWIAYAPGLTRSSSQRRLHLAFAETLTGPWRTHSANPVRLDARSSRPGGTPFIHEGELILPVQDCSRTYGGAIRLLRIDELTPDRFVAEAGDAITPPPAAAPYVDGLHTLSACGEVSLIDVKRIDRSAGGLMIDAGRMLGRWRA